jgi:hypothetical protein
LRSWQSLALGTCFASLALVTLLLAGVAEDREIHRVTGTHNAAASKYGRSVTSMKITTDEFTKLLKTIAEAWNEGNARKAADCFTEDAIYTEPPDKQVYVGRKALYEFFGGDKKPDPPMRMTWHHLSFNEEEQLGFGEYTFHGNNRYHGIVIIKIGEGKVSNWREYQYKSDLEWKAFVGQNKF